MFPEGVLIRGEYAADTAGPGTHRGGAANVYDVVARTGMRLEPLLDQPAARGGADGGGGGVLSTFDRISPGDPEWTDCLFTRCCPGRSAGCAPRAGAAGATRWPGIRRRSWPTCGTST